MLKIDEYLLKHRDIYLKISKQWKSRIYITGNINSFKLCANKFYWDLDCEKVVL